MEPDSLWVQILKGKYSREHEINGVPVAKQSNSKLWKELVKLWDDFRINTQRIEQ